MLYLVAALFACSIALVVVAVAQLVPARSSAVSQRLLELEQLGTTFTSRKRARRDRWEAMLQQLGEQVGETHDTRELRRRLIQAGYGKPNAVAIFRGVRIAVPLAAAGLALLLAPFDGSRALFLALLLAGFGWVIPSFYLDSKQKARQKEIRQALPDALDMMVICVEAGLGLNQAIMRVSEEVRHISPQLSREMALVNLEIRAGTPREEALRNLGERTGVEDVRSLSTLLIQTDRFGTSVVQALNIQSETLRTKRKQRAEEQAAKLAVKLLFPMVFFIFPALFVVAVGPAVFSFLEGLSALR
jgi:tight adherence protein C